MSALSPGVGYADDYWHNYYTPDEVEEILSVVSHTTIPTSGMPLAVRAFMQDGPAPTVMMTHGLLPHGLMMCRFYLAFHRAGFNVVTADLLGYGLSGGPRGGPTIPQLIQMWQDIRAFTRREVGDGPLFLVGTAEDSVTAYYAFANDPDISAMSLHLLLEYGDEENLFFIGNPVKRRAMMIGARAANALRIDVPFDAHIVPWDDVVSPHVETLERDPLVVTHYTTALGASMAKRMRPPVRFEDCVTPCQMIASENGRIWSAEYNRRMYERLGCPKKEFVLLEGAPQGALGDDFVRPYTENAIRWFRENGAGAAAEAEEAAARR